MALVIECCTVTRPMQLILAALNRCEPVIAPERLAAWMRWLAERENVSLRVH